MGRWRARKNSCGGGGVGGGERGRVRGGMGELEQGGCEGARRRVTKPSAHAAIVWRGEKGFKKTSI